MPKKLSALNPPLGLERDYQTSIRKLVTRARDIIDSEIVQSLSAIMGQVNALRPDTRSDDIGDDVKDLFVSVQLQLDKQLTDFEIEQLAQGTASQISAWNKAQITRVLKQGLGVDVFYSEPWLSQELNSWVNTNVKLIRNVNNAFLAETETVVFDGMRRGLRHEEIAKQILGNVKDEQGFVSKFKRAKTRANLIGRDQVNKLNGQLTGLRQKNAGVTHYIWRTVGDARVRDDHSFRSGHKFSWATGSEVGTHPGDEISCRCYGEPVLDNLLK